VRARNPSAPHQALPAATYKTTKAAHSLARETQKPYKLAKFGGMCNYTYIESAAGYKLNPGPQTPPNGADSRAEKVKRRLPTGSYPAR
jgi:hypothetical protein